MKFPLTVKFSNKSDTENSIKKISVFNRKTFTNYTYELDISEYEKYCFFTESAYYNFIINCIELIINCKIEKNKKFFTKEYTVMYSIDDDSIIFTFGSVDKHGNTKYIVLDCRKTPIDLEESIRDLAKINYKNEIAIDRLKSVTSALGACIIFIAVISLL